MAAPAALLLDLDGTLVDSEPLTTAAVEDFCRERGAPLAAGESEFVVGHGWREITRCCGSRSGSGCRSRR